MMLSLEAIEASRSRTTEYSLLTGLLPVGAACSETSSDRAGAVLFPEEEALLVGAVAKRRWEFTVGRLCARRALARLGNPPVPILAGSRGAPCWPPSFVGSITHCPGYRAAAVAPITLLSALGVDAEPNVPLPEGVLASVASPHEASAIDSLLWRMPGIRWDTLLFSAKEAVYKAWFPLTGRSLGFDGARISVEPRDGTFVADLTSTAGSTDEPAPAAVSGRWTVARGLVVTAVSVPAVAPRH
jgi:4'-phosphopantetheinyl transferase EntD